MATNLRHYPNTNIHMIFGYQEDLGGSLFNLNELFPTQDCAGQFLGIYKTLLILTVVCFKIYSFQETMPNLQILSPLYLTVRS